jgi:hypothetical protein
MGYSSENRQKLVGRGLCTIGDIADCLTDDLARCIGQRGEYLVRDVCNRADARIASALQIGRVSAQVVRCHRVHVASVASPG